MRPTYFERHLGDDGRAIEIRARSKPLVDNCSPTPAFTCGNRECQQCTPVGTQARIGYGPALGGRERRTWLARSAIQCPARRIAKNIELGLFVIGARSGATFRGHHSECSPCCAWVTGG